MRPFRLYPLILALLTNPSGLLAQDARPEVPDPAIAPFQITAPGSKPFHLKAKIVESTNADNDDYKAEIEEYWVAPDKWRRTIENNHFSQTLVINGETIQEDDTGDYYPNWLRTLVDATFDPGFPLRAGKLEASSDHVSRIQFGAPTGAVTMEHCRGTQVRAGIPPVGNDLFLNFCFDGNNRITNVYIPGYTASYKDFEEFAGKQFARTIQERIESGTTLQLSVEDLNVWKPADDSLFAVQQPHPELRTVRVSEEALRAAAVDPPAMQWPKVPDGRLSGSFSVYVCADRDGRVREVYSLNSHNPYLTDLIRPQIANWRFKPMSEHGTPAQVEGILTFAYETTLQEPKP